MRNADRGCAAAFNALAIAVLATFVFVAITVPYHATDGLLFGRWSRLIAQDGGFAYDGLLSGYYHRPLFYVGQGWLWHWTGFAEWTGRVFSLAFAVTLGAALHGLARALTPARGVAAIVGAAAVCLLIATPDAVRDAAGGQTDVPAAAMVGAAGWLALGRETGYVRLGGMGLLALAAGLSKPSALAGVVGLIAALSVLRSAEPDFRARVAALSLGLAAALAYAAWQGARLRLGLIDFLRGVNPSEGTALDTASAEYFGAVSAQVRRTIVLGFEWLGPYLVVPLLFTVAYAMIRSAGRSHRSAATVAAASALAASIVLPAVAQSAGADPVGPWHVDRPAAAAASLAFAIGLWFARTASEAYHPPLWAVRFLTLWASVPLLTWVVVSPAATRYLSPAWPALLVLMAWLLVAAMDGLRAGGRYGGVALAAVLMGVALADLRNLDGLGAGSDGSVNSLRAVKELGVSGWFDADEARRAADPELGALLAASRRVINSDDIVLTSDSRLGFHFPRQVRQRVARRCSDLSGADVFVLVETLSDQLDDRAQGQLDPEVRELVYRGGLRDPRRWTRCRDPRLVERGGVPGVFRIYRLQKR